MTPTGQDSLKTRSTLNVGSSSYAYYSLEKAGQASATSLVCPSR